MSKLGLCVAVLGVDGVGKSTVIDALIPLLGLRGFTVQQHHLRPGLLPPLARLKGQRAQHIGPVTDPHGAKASGRIASLMRALYLLADYVLGYWLVIRPTITHSPTIVLFDRYAYDMLIDPRRFRISLPGGLMRWLTGCAPRPDIIICLHGDPDMIARRKQELPLSEVRRQIAALLEYAKSEPRAVLISTEGAVNEARDQVLEVITNHCLHRAPGQADGG